ncbi:acid phosphatase/vanadium-dependent haloperoxidase related protein [Thermaerobacter marianensis DSM 12885]|uniref:Acid phosphatase/vanadium-dependent haloperoxidase related protein n=1 Tax=Thermaerobacter marianensis (strain ATCC 700841 / DSM 12885 / JCM 10246 / 7p75a) TaxID=644966 RepID=E6SHJ0_THEM7|nr:divergent PAP2 family protein [Thermaerobacter marianensis]ADU51785.1 acid phosphatase/vanadium-dependent haloperoxidase related protein [Thermaerobacter marianensis DSM 12885]
MCPACVLLSRYNQPLVSAVAAAGLGQATKAVLAAVTGKDDPKAALVKAGGMPSAHAALAIALLTSVVSLEGWTSPTTGLAAILAVLVLYDAMVVRRAVEQLAATVRELVECVAQDRPTDLAPPPVPSSLGHTPPQVLAGAMLGFTVAHLLLWLSGH